MTHSTAVLSFGNDSRLLWTRGLVLLSAGIRVVSVGSLQAFGDALAGDHFDLLLFCHSLSVPDCQTALAMAAQVAPSASKVVMGAPNGHSCTATEPNFNQGPAELIAMIQSLMVSRPPYLAGGGGTYA